MRSPPAHHQSDDQDQARFNRETVDALSHILGRAGVDYDIQTVNVTTSATKVPHKLGRRWVGWYVIDRTNNAGIRRVAPPAGIDPAKELWVDATLASTVKILVF